MGSREPDVGDGPPNLRARMQPIHIVRFEQKWPRGPYALACRGRTSTRLDTKVPIYLRSGLFKSAHLLSSGLRGIFPQGTTGWCDLPPGTRLLRTGGEQRADV